MATTRAQIVSDALRECGVNPNAQDPAAPENSIVQTIFDATLAELQAAEIAAWSTDTTPDELRYWLALLVAQRAAPRVATEDREASLKGLGMEPYRKIVALSGKKWNGEWTTADKF